MLTLKREELPGTLVAHFPSAEEFGVSIESDAITLHPSCVTADDVRAHFDRIGITQQDIEDAVEEVRAEAWRRA